MTPSPGVQLQDEPGCRMDVEDAAGEMLSVANQRGAGTEVVAEFAPLAGQREVTLGVRTGEQRVETAKQRSRERGSIDGMRRFNFQRCSLRAKFRREMSLVLETVQPDSDGDGDRPCNRSPRLHEYSRQFPRADINIVGPSHHGGDVGFLTDALRDGDGAGHHPARCRGAILRLEKKH